MILIAAAAVYCVLLFGIRLLDRAARPRRLINFP